MRVRHINLLHFEDMVLHKPQLASVEPVDVPKAPVRIPTRRPTRPTQLGQPKREHHDPMPRSLPGPDVRKPWERVHDAIESVARNRVTRPR